MLEPLTDWVALSPRFTPGWPWPENSYGLGPMYGDEGWCRGCGTPLSQQTGALVIQSNKFPTAEVWMPNWLYDVVCVSAQVAADISERFNVDLGDVHNLNGLCEPGTASTTANARGRPAGSAAAGSGCP